MQNPREKEFKKEQQLLHWPVGEIHTEVEHLNNWVSLPLFEWSSIGHTSNAATKTGVNIFFLILQNVQI